MQNILDVLPTQIAILDGTGEIQVTNRAWQAVTEQGGPCTGQRGPRRNYLEECAAAAKRGCAEAGDVWLGIKRVIEGETDLFIKVYPCAFNGIHHWYQVAVSPAPVGDRRGAVVMHTDVTALQHDPLTGLANRLLFDAQLALTLAQAGRAGQIAGLLYIDLDRFKPVNDSLGHRAGDRLLVEVASRLQGCVRASDLAARLGGDEFAVVLGPATDATALEGIADRVVAVLGQPFTIEDRTVRVGASAGLALWPRHGGTAEQLIERADQALYAAKAAGRGRYRTAGALAEAGG